MKIQKDRQEYIDDFYAAHPEAPRPLSRYNSSTVVLACSPPGHQQHVGCFATADPSRLRLLIPKAI